MWKPEHRVAADRGGLRYPSDLTDAEWVLIAPLIPPAKRGGRKRTVDLREVLTRRMNFPTHKRKIQAAYCAAKLPRSNTPRKKNVLFLKRVRYPRVQVLCGSREPRPPVAILSPLAFVVRWRGEQLNELFRATRSTSKARSPSDVTSG
jgi:transposase